MLAVTTRAYMCVLRLSMIKNNLSFFGKKSIFYKHSLNTEKNKKYCHMYVKFVKSGPCNKTFCRQCLSAVSFTLSEFHPCLIFTIKA